MPDASTLTFRLNGRAVRYAGPPTAPLVDVLRETCGDTSVKLGCSRAVCGSCTVLIDGTPGASCALFAYHADGAEIETAAGFAADADADAAHPIAEAFAEAAAFQCGYCTGGMLMLTKALLARHPHPDRELVVRWISSNICRCTGYAMIVDAVLDAARRLRERADA